MACGDGGSFFVGEEGHYSLSTVLRFSSTLPGRIPGAAGCRRRGVLWRNVMDSLTRGAEGVDGGLERPPWPQRSFSFVHPPWMLADFTERLRGLVPRLAPLLSGLTEEQARHPLDGKWSIAQNVGHLSDVEELWQERLEDLRQGKGVYTPAVAARFQALALRHQERSLQETVAELSARRTSLVNALNHASPELQRASAFHERLKVPMRLVDCAQFYAEHDDHHCLRIRAIRSRLGLAAA